MNDVIDRIENHAKTISNFEHEKIKPGMEVSFTDACTLGDTIRQGDLYLIVADKIPQEYNKVEKLGEIDKQLVPGNTQGAKHCLDSLDGVTLYKPKIWNEESLDGPCLVLEKERKVLHPIHGSVVIPAGFTIQCVYQREYDKELEKERRTRD